MKKIVFVVLCALLSSIIANAEQTDSVSKSKPDWLKYLPTVHGTVRPRMEMEFGHGLPTAARFQVKNARLSLEGSVGNFVDYMFNTDFCDQGKITILDVWARVNAPKGLSFQMGQFRLPFGVDPFRGPNNYIFANRSFIGKQVCNIRGVGFQIGYKAKGFPLTVEAGIFNPTPIGDHIIWTTKFAYAAKVGYTLDRVKLATGFQSLRPDGVRANLFDVAATWTPSSRWIVEAEYMYKHYVHRAHKPVNSWLVWADYKLPIKAWMFNRLSFQGRFDGMTDHSTGARGSEGHLVTNHPFRNRVTVGSTISWIKSANLFADIRVNYEKYFYHSDATIAQGDGDKFLVELVVRF